MGIVVEDTSSQMLHVMDSMANMAYIIYITSVSW